VLKAKLALITGASSGLGLALSHALSKHGIELLLTARNEEKLKSAAADLPPSTQLVACDLSHPEERKQLLELVHQKKPDLIINCAGFGLYGPALSHPTSSLIAMVEVNVQALMELTLEGAKAMIAGKKQGVILNISSAAAFHAYPTFCVYAATKSFVNFFSQGMHEELKAQGIHVLTVCPGQIDTEFKKVASKGFFQKKDKMTMTTEKAVNLILKQLDRLEPFSIIDWRYKWIVGLSKFLPKKWVMNALAKSLKKRTFTSDQGT
jgi:short-subunit dehydrogenase